MTANTLQGGVLGVQHGSPLRIPTVEQHRVNRFLMQAGMVFFELRQPGSQHRTAYLAQRLDNIQLKFRGNHSCFQFLQPRGKQLLCLAVIDRRQRQQRSLSLDNGISLQCITKYTDRVSRIVRGQDTCPGCP